MTNNPQRGHVPPYAPDPVQKINKHLDICKKFIDATDCTRVSMLVTFKHQGKEYNEVLLFDKDNNIPVPKQELYDFFNSLGQTLIANKLAISKDDTE